MPLEDPCEDQVFGFDTLALDDAVFYLSLFDACVGCVEPGNHRPVFNCTVPSITTHIIIQPNFKAVTKK